MESSTRGALATVVTMVARTLPRAAKSLARSTMGIMWPGARNGRKKMWISSMELVAASLELQWPWEDYKRWELVQGFDQREAN